MATDKDIEAFIASRKEGWRGKFRKDPAQAATLLRKHGKASLGDSILQGLQQGASHGFADETERAVTGGPAKNHILAQASNPTAYMLSQILGLAATGGLVRGTGGAIGKVRSAPLRRGSGSVAAGGQGRAIERAAKAKDIEETWGNFPFGKNTDPRVRGFALDAAHGAALGYGGIDPTQDDDALSVERFKRAGLSLGASLALAPIATSMGVASTNIPLLFGGRRIGSRKMLEPPGVSRRNPSGNPRQAIEIARSMDESAARANAPPPRRLSEPSLTTLERAVYEGRKQGLSDREIAIRQGWDPDEPPNYDEFDTLFSRTGAKKKDVDAVRTYISKQAREAPTVEGFADPSMKALLDERHKSAVRKIKAAYIENRRQEPVGIIARDTDPPLQSKGKRTQELADLALEPIATDRISQMRAAERGQAARSIEEAYPVPPSARPYADVPERRFETPGGKRYVVEFAPGANKGVSVAFRRDRKGLARSLTNDFGSNGKASLRETRDVLRGVEKAIEDDIGAGGRAYYSMMGSDPKRSRLYDRMAKRIAPPENYHVSSMPEAGAQLTRTRETMYQPDEFVDGMMEAFTRQDRPALESWMSTLDQRARRDPGLMERVRGRVAQQLAINERADPRLNDTPTMREFLHALGMAGNKAKGIPNVLDAARQPASAAHNSERYQAALSRLGKKGPRLRTRHAEALRREMEAFKPGPYTGPHDPRMGPPLVLRGDDQARFISPLDFYRKGKVSNNDVTATGLFSGPIAMGADAVMRMGEERPEWDDRGPPVIEGQFQEVRPQPAPSAPAPPAGILPQLAPQQPGNPVLEAAAAGQAPPAVAPIDLAEAQKVMSAVAGIPLERFGADGKMGPETQAALTRFQQAARIPVTGQLDELTARRLAQLRDGQLPEEMVAEIRAGLGGR